MGLHADSNNADTPNLLIPLSHFEGGHLFVEDGNGNYMLDQQGPTGYVHLVTLPFLTFDAAKRHLVLPWAGRRLILGAYHIRDADRLPHHFQQGLRGLGFAMELRKVPPTSAAKHSCPPGSTADAGTADCSS